MMDTRKSSSQSSNNASTSNSNSNSNSNCTCTSTSTGRSESTRRQQQRNSLTTTSSNLAAEVVSGLEKTFGGSNRRRTFSAPSVAASEEEEVLQHHHQRRPRPSSSSPPLSPGNSNSGRKEGNARGGPSTPKSDNSKTALSETDSDASKSTSTTTTTTTTSSDTAPKLTRWSEVLNSPPDGGSISSPSLPLHKSLHGHALTLAVDRAKVLSKCGKRCSNLFQDVATLHDGFAQSILRASQTHHADLPPPPRTTTTASTLGFSSPDRGTATEVTTPTPTTTTASTTTQDPLLPSSTTISTLNKEVHNALISFSRQERGLAICIKGSVARPLLNSYTAIDDTVPGVFQQYTLTREGCCKCRAEAVKCRKLYGRAVKEAEGAVKEWLNKVKKTGVGGVELGMVGFGSFDGSEASSSLAAAAGGGVRGGGMEDSGGIPAGTTTTPTHGDTTNHSSTGSSSSTTPAVVGASNSDSGVLLCDLPSASLDSCNSNSHSQSNSGATTPQQVTSFDSAGGQSTGGSVAAAASAANNSGMMDGLEEPLHASSESSEAAATAAATSSSSSAAVLPSTPNKSWEQALRRMGMGFTSTSTSTSTSSGGILLTSPSNTNTNTNTNTPHTPNNNTNNNTTPTILANTSDPQQAKLIERVMNTLNTVRSSEKEYVASVKAENCAVERSQTMEVMGLESLQKLEEERVYFFVETMGRFLQADKGALDNMSLSLRKFSEDNHSGVRGRSNTDGSSAPSSVPTSRSTSPSTPLQERGRQLQVSSPPPSPPPAPPSVAAAATPPAFFSKMKSPQLTGGKVSSSGLDGGGGIGSVSGGSTGVSWEGLNLSEELVDMREKLRKSWAIRAERVQATKGIYQFVEELAAAADAFASGMRSRLQNEGYWTTPHQTGGLMGTSDTLASSLRVAPEGPAAIKYWSAVVETMVNSATTATALAAELRKYNQQYLGRIVQTLEKELKSGRDAEESRWKTLCDAARAEIRAKSKLEQTSSDLVKARERLGSVERVEANEEETTSSAFGGGGFGKQQKNLNPAMSKALGNMFAILPGGGEEAMAKMLSVKQRQAIAKTNVEEAQNKTAKEKQALTILSSNKAAAIATYERMGRAIQEGFQSQEYDGWSKAKELLNCIIQSFLNFRGSRYNSLLPAMEIVGSNRLGTHGEASADIEHWTKKMQEKISQQRTAAEKAEVETGSLVGIRLKTPKDGFAMSIKLEDSAMVHKLIALVDGEGNREETSGSTGAADGATPGDIPSLPTVKESLTEATDLSDDEDNVGKSTSSKDGVLAGDETCSPAVSILRRSQSAPVSVSEQSGRQLSTATPELLSLAAVLKEPSRGKTEKTMAEEDGSGGRVDASTTSSQTPEKGQAPSSKTSETDLFLAHFWEDGAAADGGEDPANGPPKVIESFSCAYWPKEDEGYYAPLLHGRMFITANALYFIGWGGKKIVLRWEDCKSVKKDTTVNGLVDNALRITCDGENDAESSYFFGSFAFRESAFQLLTRLITVSRSLKEIAKKKQPRGAKKLPPVPPDVTVKKMEPLFSRKLNRISIQQYYELCWSEGNKTKAEPFYGPWLTASGNHEVSVGDWEYAAEGQPFKKQWCGETYSQKRIATFKYKRTTHLYMGPPVADVTQTHHCRIEGNDKCVLTMTVKMDGIPYADTFCVEVRWVARRVGNEDIQLDAGIVVDFKKSSMFAKQIKSGTLTESKPTHLDLFENVKKICDVCDDGRLGTTPVDQDGEVSEKENEAVDNVESEIVATSSERSFLKLPSEIPDVAKLLLGGVLGLLSIPILYHVLPDMYLFRQGPIFGVFMFFVGYSLARSSADFSRFSLVRGEKQGVVERKDFDALSLKVDKIDGDLAALHETLKKVLTTLEKSNKK